MAEMTQTRGRGGSLPRTEVRASAPGLQAYRLLHIAFIVAPTIAGLDKFFHLLVNWDQYLSPQVARLLPMSPHGFMLLVGIIEIAAGLWVAIQPRTGAYVVAVWLAAIVLNLLFQGRYLDIALRDFGLMLGALALGRLSETYARGRSRLTPSTA
ncbi:hypothetical protein LY474_19395 [Myxococcus stipitatus]|uniref:hypothetical protein n=1 Tax=Myxococcus stipitatus TaxID=83455 RepID=UPI001F1F80E5|nr:hypothetical protein [Myxococcus stipitatus]MCE9669968.1 hypothetical protein [Myxococcus stipitatus]